MQRVAFGSTGETVSEMCLGTMMFGDRCDERESDRILSVALDAGVDFLDTAALYAGGATEEILGRLLKGRRDKVFLVTKVRIDLDDVLKSIEASLKRLRIDYVDAYLIHAPAPGMNPQQIMRDLNKVVQDGKARFVGCSNYPAWLLAHSNRIAERQGWPQLVCNQVPYSLIERGVEVEILPQAYTEQIAVMAYRPLGIGLLSGKYAPGRPLPENSRAITDERIPNWLNRYSTEVASFLKMADELGVAPATLAVAWVRRNRAITSPIIGVSSLRQLETNLAAFEFDLSDEQYRRLNDMFAATAPFEIASWKPFAEMRRDLDLITR